MIDFEERAVARLRERLGEVEEANQDLIAFARGHSGAVASIHAAALAAVEADSVKTLLSVATRRWPGILGIDAVALALVVGDRGFRAGSSGIEAVEARFVQRMALEIAPVEVRRVRGGHQLFGPAVADHIRAQALIRIDSGQSSPKGLLVLGQRAELQLESRHGSELLLFLGRLLGAAAARAAASR